MVPRRALAQSQRTGQGVAAAADHLTLASSAAPDLTTHACMQDHAMRLPRTRTKPHAAPAPRLYRTRQSTRCGARLWQEVAQQRGRIRVVAKHHRAVFRDRLASLACCLRLGRRLTARAWRTAVMRPRVCSCTHVRFAMRR